MIYVGIDPGKDGAVVALNERGEFVLQRIAPTVNIAKHGNKRDYLESEMAGILSFDGIVLAVLEKTQAMPGQGGTSMHSLGEGEGIWRGILAALRIPYQRVHPRTWQKELHRDIGGDNPKAKSAIAAGRLFPGHDFRATPKCRKPHEGLIDAALLAWYAKMNAEF